MTYQIVGLSKMLLDIEFQKVLLSDLDPIFSRVFADYNSETGKNWLQIGMSDHMKIFSVDGYREGSDDHTHITISSDHFRIYESDLNSNLMYNCMLETYTRCYRDKRLKQLLS